LAPTPNWIETEIFHRRLRQIANASQLGHGLCNRLVDEMLTTAPRDDRLIDEPARNSDRLSGRAEAAVRVEDARADENALQYERHGYRASQGSRIYGGAGTATVFSLLAVCAVLALNHFDRPIPPPARLSLATLPISSPEKPEPKKAEKPKPVEKPLLTPTPKQPEQVKRPLLSLSPVVTPAVVTPQVAPDPKPQPVQIAPPPSPPAPAPSPPQPRVAKGPDKWEGRIIARLERFRRYPGDAQRARQQGTAYIRFRVGRDGHVLSSSLERSSGFAALDSAALETLRSADPLPKIPADRPDQVELVVPIEFAIAR
jgi:protein TonB